MEKARCHAHATEYPWTQDCPRCAKDAMERGMPIDEYYHCIRPTITPEAARHEFSLDSEHDGDGAYPVANFTPDANGEWVRWDAYVAHLDNERERCARLVEVYARVLDESIKGGIGDSARTLAKYIRDGALP